MDYLRQRGFGHSHMQYNMFCVHLFLQLLDQVCGLRFRDDLILKGALFNRDPLLKWNI